MQRVVITGISGGGKSVVARQLSESLGMPVFSIDEMIWLPGWVRVSEQEFDSRHKAILSQDRWILEGMGPWTSMGDRLRAADTIVLLDYRIWVHCWWVLKRQWAETVLRRPQEPEWCPRLQKLLRTLRTLPWSHRTFRTRLFDLVERHCTDQTLHHIRSPQELAAFVERTS